VNSSLPSITFHTSIASFGATLNDTCLDGILDIAIPFDGCDLINKAINNSIALIQRGNCKFAEKVRRAEVAGAIAVGIINTSDLNITMSGEPKDNDITIPSFLIPRNIGIEILKHLHAPIRVEIELDESLSNGQYTQIDLRNLNKNILVKINTVLQMGGKLTLQTIDGQPIDGPVQLILDNGSIISITNEIPVVKNIQTKVTEQITESITNKPDYQIKLNPYDNCKKISDQYSMNISHSCLKYNSKAYYGNGINVHKYTPKK